VRGRSIFTLNLCTGAHHAGCFLDSPTAVDPRSRFNPESPRASSGYVQKIPDQANHTAEQTDIGRRRLPLNNASAQPKTLPLSGSIGSRVEGYAGMNVYWLYDLPTWLFGLLSVAVTVAVGLVGFLRNAEMGETGPWRRAFA
jgi:hypothetical protein